MPTARQIVHCQRALERTILRLDENLALFGELDGTGYRSYGSTQSADPLILDDFAASGFDMLSIANNHSMDLSERGLLSWIDESTRRGFTVAGGGRNFEEATKPGVVTAKGQRVGMLAFLRASEDLQRPEYMAGFRAQANKAGIGLVTGTRVTVPGSPIPLLLPRADDMRMMTEAIRRARGLMC
jgi:hypothetical protein